MTTQGRAGVNVPSASAPRGRRGRVSDCPECHRAARYMAADPEMYRGEERRCQAHRSASTPQPTIEERVARLRGWTWKDVSSTGAVLIFPGWYLIAPDGSEVAFAQELPSLTESLCGEMLDEMAATHTVSITVDAFSTSVVGVWPGFPKRFADPDRKTAIALAWEAWEESKNGQ